MGVPLCPAWVISATATSLSGSLWVSPRPSRFPERFPRLLLLLPLARRLFAVHYHSTLTFVMRPLFYIIDTIKFLFLGTLVFIYTYSTHVSSHQEQNRFSCPTSALGITLTRRESTEPAVMWGLGESPGPKPTPNRPQTSPKAAPKRPQSGPERGRDINCCYCCLLLLFLSRQFLFMA